MGYYDITNDYLEIISGSSSKYSRPYTEAANKTKNVKYAEKALKAFTKSIKKVKNNKKSDKAIDDSRGNIKQFSGYDDIEKTFAFLKMHSFSSPLLTDLQGLYDSIVKYTSEYVKGYEKQVFLIIYEYHQAVYLLSTGLLIVLSRDIDIVDSDKDLKIKFVKKVNTDKRVGQYTDIINKYNGQLKMAKHQEYLRDLIQNKEVAGIDTNITEGTVADVVSSIGSLADIGFTAAVTGINAMKYIKNTAFGIIPLIRSIIYLKYKSKADAINSLHSQISYLEQNINRLENKTAMDPKKKEVIIKKQRAYIEAYKKRADKLIAELSESEKDAAVALTADNKVIEQEMKDDDIVIEHTEINEYINNYREE
jgi:hypothetical protein